MPFRSLGYRTDVMVRRLSGSTFDDRGEYAVVRTPDNPGFWWGNFVLLPSLPAMAEVERYEELFAAEFPQAKHRAYGVDTTDGDTGDDAVREALGVRAEVSTILIAASLVEAKEPGAELRPLATDADWAQLVDLDLAVYPTDEPAEVEFRRRQTGGYRGLVRAGYGAWWGAFVDETLVASLGIVSDESGLARFQAVQTHPDFQRRGLCRRLLFDAAEYARDTWEATQLVIAADPEYHAIELYRSAGFTDAELQVQLIAAPPPADQPAASSLSV